MSAMTFVSANLFGQDLELKGVIDFTVPEGGSSGKAIHLYVINNITDLSLYGIGVANNGGGTDGEEYTFPVMAANAGDHILLPRDTAAMTSYMESLNQFDIVIEADVATQNGDDAIELFFNGAVIETFGDVDCQPSEDGVTTTCPNFDYYENAWAYKNGSTWVFAEAFCTDDGTTTSASSSCPYPFSDPSLSVLEFKNSSFSVFPNPVTDGQLNIETSFQGPKLYVIYDLNGRVVYEETKGGSVLNVSHLNSGVYLLKIEVDNQFQTTKLIIK